MIQSRELQTGPRGGTGYFLIQVCKNLFGSRVLGGFVFLFACLFFIFFGGGVVPHKKLVLVTPESQEQICTLSFKPHVVCSRCHHGLVTSVLLSHNGSFFNSFMFLDGYPYFLE